MSKTEHIFMVTGDRDTRDEINTRRNFGAKKFNHDKTARKTANASKRTNRTR